MADNFSTKREQLEQRMKERPRDKDARKAYLAHILMQGERAAYLTEFLEEWKLVTQRDTLQQLQRLDTDAADIQRDYQAFWHFYDYVTGMITLANSKKGKAEGSEMND